MLPEANVFYTLYKPEHVSGHTFLDAVSGDLKIRARLWKSGKKGDALMDVALTKVPMRKKTRLSLQIA